MNKIDNTIFFFFKIVVMFFVFLNFYSQFVGCIPIIQNIDEYKDIDKYGCVQPPSSIFTSAGIDLHFAKSTFGKIVIGNIDLSSNPQVISLATKAVTNDRIKSYLRCLAIKRDGYTQQQAVYLEELSAFMSTKPTSKEFISWQKANPFPVNQSDNKSTFHYSQYINKIISRNNRYYTFVIATGTASCGKLSLDDCKKKAYTLALENAAHQGSEVFIKSKITLNNSEIVEDEVQAVTTAKIIYHEILKQGMDGESGYSYTIYAYVERVLMPIKQSNNDSNQDLNKQKEVIMDIQPNTSEFNNVQDNEGYTNYDFDKTNKGTIPRWKLDKELE